MGKEKYTDNNRFGVRIVGGELFDNHAIITGVVNVLDTFARYGGVFVMLGGVNATLDDFRKDVMPTDKTVYRVERAYWSGPGQSGELVHGGFALCTPLSVGAEAYRGPFYVISEPEAKQLALLNLQGNGTFKVETEAQRGKSTSGLITPRTKLFDSRYIQ